MSKIIAAVMARNGLNHAQVGNLTYDQLLHYGGVDLDELYGVAAGADSQRSTWSAMFKKVAARIGIAVTDLYLWPRERLVQLICEESGEKVSSSLVCSALADFQDSQ